MGLAGRYDNGSAQGKGRTEYIWLPTEDGSAIPIGLYKNGKFYAVHSDHLGTPRLITDQDKKPVWQWPYSAFGTNKPTGVLAATPTPTGHTSLRASKSAVETNLRFPGQYLDEESNLIESGFRSYGFGGRYAQPDPIGLAGGLNRFAYVLSNPLFGTLTRRAWRVVEVSGEQLAALAARTLTTPADTVVSCLRQIRRSLNAGTIKQESGSVNPGRQRCPIQETRRVHRWCATRDAKRRSP